MAGQRRPVESSAPSGRDLARALSQVALALEAERTTTELLAAIPRMAVATVPGAEEATVALVSRGRGAETLTGTDPAAVEADRLQRRTGEGPHAEAVWQRTANRIDDLASDPGCPAFGPAAATLGVRSLLALRLLQVGDRLTVLTVYARRPAAFDDRSELAGLLFAAHAAVALASSQREHQLWEAIRSRDVIGQAKGMLMERHGVSQERAFLMLSEASQATNVKVRDIAEHLVRDHRARGPGGRVPGRTHPASGTQAGRTGVGARR